MTIAILCLVLYIKQLYYEGFTNLMNEVCLRCRVKNSCISWLYPKLLLPRSWTHSILVRSLEMCRTCHVIKKLTYPCVKIKAVVKLLLSVFLVRTVKILCLKFHFDNLFNFDTEEFSIDLVTWFNGQISHERTIQTWSEIAVFY